VNGNAESTMTFQNAINVPVPPLLRYVFVAPGSFQLWKPKIPLCWSQYRVMLAMLELDDLWELERDMI
jgi:hypothetical protein